MLMPEISRGLAIIACLAMTSPIIDLPLPSAGASTAKVAAARSSTQVIDVYTDYQCPSCARILPRINELKRKYGSGVQFSFKNFPLPQHRNALLAAYAAEAAGRQGKFHEMHNRLFSGQREWSKQSDPSGIFVGYANGLNLNAAKFRSDVGSAAVKGQVAADLRRGQSLGINQTPTLMVGGKPITGSNLNQLERVIDESISTSHKRS